MPLHVPPSKAQRMRDEFARVSEWMQSHGAHVLVDNLAPGATPRELDAFEQQYHLRYPDDLRALWSLHAGQRSTLNGYFAERDFLGPAASHAAQQAVVEAHGSMRPDPAWTAESGLTLEDAQSDAWFVVAARGDNNLVVLSGLAGRVYARGKDPSTFRLIASSLLSWVEHYAYSVERGEYQVTAGLGDAYLEYTCKGDTKEERYFLEQISSVVPDLRDVIGTAFFASACMLAREMTAADFQYQTTVFEAPDRHCFVALTARVVVLVATRPHIYPFPPLECLAIRQLPLSTISSISIVERRLTIESAAGRLRVKLGFVESKFPRTDRLLEALVEHFQVNTNVATLRADFARAQGSTSKLLFTMVVGFVALMACRSTCFH